MRHRRLIGRSAVVAVASIGSLLATSVAGTTSAAPVSERPDHRGATPPRVLPLRVVVDRTDDGLLARLATVNDVTVRRLRSIATDRTAFLDRGGRLLYVDDFGAARDAAPSAEAAPLALAKTFSLHSLRRSNRTIYLDFTGHTVKKTAWNAGTGDRRQRYSPYSMDRHEGSFTTTEKSQIQHVWQRVAEDYAPFNVDVTTQQPKPSDIQRSGRKDKKFGTRLLVTDSGAVYRDPQFCNRLCGGVAYNNVFDLFGKGRGNHARYQPAFVFTAGTGTGAKNIAEAAAHEVGHTLSLKHDGKRGGAAYYAGHGPWAPIMGVGYNHPISQWSSGQYKGANNKQNDVKAIAHSGAPFRRDDHGDGVGHATNVRRKAGGVISTRGDEDVFRFTAGGRKRWTITARPARTGANLDVRLRILNKSGKVVASANPPAGQHSPSLATGLSAGIRHKLPGKHYFVEVSGAGFRKPATNGYSDYGSLGRFRLSIKH